MLLAIGVSLAVLLAGAAAVILLAHWRRTPEGEARLERGVMEDCGDEAVWEGGKSLPIADTKEYSPNLSKRSFLRRAAFTASAFCVTWLASRGRSGALGATFSTDSDDRQVRNDGGIKKLDVSPPPSIHDDANHTDGMHQDSPHEDQAHNDSYYDTNEAPHMDTMGHTDSDHVDTDHNDYHVDD